MRDIRIERDPVLEELQTRGIRITPPFGPRSVRDPNPVQNLRTFVYPNKSEDEIEQAFNTLPDNDYRKILLRAILDRLEFIKRLLTLRKFLVERKVLTVTTDSQNAITFNEEITFHEMDFNGVDYDIESLCLYLLTTCIDTAVKNDVDERISGTLFRERTIKNMSQDLQSRIVNKFAVVRLDNGNIEQHSLVKWDGYSDSKKVEELINHLYIEVRCAYTHTGRRTFLPETPVSALLARKDPVIVLRSSLEDDKLLSLVKDILIEIVRGRLLNI